MEVTEMPKSCAVCRRLDRAEIDLRLARHQVNVAGIAREIGCGETTVRRHRDQHVPAFLRVYGAQAELPSVGSIHAELLRLYTSTLDALALAEAGTLEGLNEDGSERRKVSHSAIQGYVREARRLLGEITALAADAGGEDERPTGMARGELAQRIMERLDRPRTTSMHSDADLVHDYAEPCIVVPAVATELALPPAECQTTPGGQAGSRPVRSPSQKALDAAIAPENLPGVQTHPRLAQVIRDHEATKQKDDPALEDSPAVMYAPNPNYPGSAASSAEERAAAGYPDIPITEDDIKSLPDEVRRLIAEHRASDPRPASPSPEDDG